MGKMTGMLEPGTRIKRNPLHANANRVYTVEGYGTFNNTLYALITWTTFDGVPGARWVESEIVHRDYMVVEE